VSASDTIRQSFIKIVRAIFMVKDEDITCDECYRHIDMYVDMLADGTKPSQVLNRVESHLKQCPYCEEEFQALISIIEAAERSNEN